MLRTWQDTKAGLACRRRQKANSLDHAMAGLKYDTLTMRAGGGAVARGAEDHPALRDVGGQGFQAHRRVRHHRLEEMRARACCRVRLHG